MTTVEWNPDTRELFETQVVQWVNDYIAIMDGERYSVGGGFSPTNVSHPHPYLRHNRRYDLVALTREGQQRHDALCAELWAATERLAEAEEDCEGANPRVEMKHLYYAIAALRLDDVADGMFFGLFSAGTSEYC